MQAVSGIRIHSGIAIGRIRIHRRSVNDIEGRRAQEREREEARFLDARRRCQEIQRRLYDRASVTAGEESARIFRFRAYLLEDEELIRDVERRIGGGLISAERAVKEGFDAAADKLRGMEDPYLRERAGDIADVEETLLRILSDAEGDGDEGILRVSEEEPAILAASDLAPSEAVLFGPSILGLILAGGSADSHTSILMRGMHLPGIVQCREYSEDWEGRTAILDGESGIAYIDPTPDLLEQYRARKEAARKREVLLQEFRGKPNVTLDGRSIRISANIHSPAETAAVRENDADGVGLFRSEFLYLESGTEPSEETQFGAYRRVLESLAPMQIVIRTCDLGADKRVGYLDLAREENPALGLRGVRVGLLKRDFFKRQLRALLRASAYGNLSILLPMITSPWEVRSCRNLLEECRRELAGEGINVDRRIPLGVMIETPAAVWCADDLAREADFFSIGTNDLTQYTLAIDRNGASLGRFFDPHHPAVLAAVRQSVEAAHARGIQVGICGELAADPSMAETFLRMGVDELSVSPASVLGLRQVIRCLDLSEKGADRH